MLNVKDYGAVGDGSTDDTSAFVAAFNDGNQLFIPYSAGGYKLSGSMNLVNSSITGEPGAKLIHNSNNPLFQIVGDNVEINNLIIDGTNSISTVAVIFNSAPVKNINFKNLVLTNSPGLVSNTVTNQLIKFLTIDNIKALAPRGSTINLTTYLHLSSIHNVHVDYTASSSPNYPAIVCSYGNTISTSLFIDKICIQGSDNVAYSNQHGIVLGAGEHTTVSNVNTLHLGGSGFVGNSSINFRLADCDFSFGHRDQISLNTCLYSTITNCMARGRANGSLSSLNSSTYGIALHNCDSINISNCDFKSNGAGIYQDSSVNITYTGGQSCVNTYYGIISTGTTCSGLTTGVIFSNNGLLNIIHTGSGQFAYTCRGNSGVIINLTGKGTV